MAKLPRCYLYFAAIMVKDFYIIRHGETEYNRRGMVQGGSIDAPLNQTGKDQAWDFFMAYKNVGFDKIYHSTLIRTKQTIEPFIPRGIITEEAEALDEMNFGVYEGKNLNLNEKKSLEKITQCLVKNIKKHLSKKQVLL